jgi:hypothetical protein
VLFARTQTVITNKRQETAQCNVADSIRLHLIIELVNPAYTTPPPPSLAKTFTLINANKELFN